MERSPSSIGSSLRWCLVVVCLATLGSLAQARQFSFANNQIPQGSPFNTSFSEEVSFGDVDLDGDLDAAIANGGDYGNDQSRLWINQGGAQGGSLGFFSDVTATQFPALLCDSRDIEFADIDNDGDPDLYQANTSTVSNQPCRWWVNVGGQHHGTAGFFRDETAMRWINLGVNDGTTTFSSIAPALVLPLTGGFIDWAGTGAFADFDNDGDLDLFIATKGGAGNAAVPARIFLNDGDGFFEEFNPSGFQLTSSTISNGNPALWAQGAFMDNTTNNTGLFADITARGVAVEVGDADLDFDLDVLYVSESWLPRLFRNNNLAPGVMVALTDVTTAWFPPNWGSGPGAYEAEFGDLDNDSDIDIYGNGWFNVCDSVLKNNGDGTFAPPVMVLGSCSDDEDQEYIDYDSDGDLDVFVAGFSGQERLFRNTGAPNYTLVDATNGNVPPDSTTSRGIATGDIDLDGDVDVLIANAGQPNTLFLNVGPGHDTSAPRIARVEQAPARIASPAPTVVRALIYDNASFNLVALQPATLEYDVDGGAFVSVPMHWSGGFVFRGTIPGALVGQIRYRVTATDAQGNSATSGESYYFALASGCAGDTTLYCTAKLNSLGCTPAVYYTGAPSAGGASPFHVLAQNVLSNKSGVLFYSLNGQQAAAFQGGTLCVRLPVQRTAVQNSGGNPPPTDCSGVYDFDFGAYLAGGTDPNLVAGVTVDAQYWSRDPGFAPPDNTGLTGGIHFQVCP